MKNNSKIIATFCYIKGIITIFAYRNELKIGIMESLKLKVVERLVKNGNNANESKLMVETKLFDQALKRGWKTPSQIAKYIVNFI